MKKNQVNNQNLFLFCFNFTEMSIDCPLKVIQVGWFFFLIYYTVFFPPNMLKIIWVRTKKSQSWIRIIPDSHMLKMYCSNNYSKWIVSEATVHSEHCTRTVYCPIELLVLILYWDLKVVKMFICESATFLFEHQIRQDWNCKNCCLTN